MKKYFKLGVVTIIALLVLLVANVPTVQADVERVPGAIWTPSDCGPNAQVDKMTFMYGETVYLAGGKFMLAPNTTYHYLVTKTGGGAISFEGDITTNEYGNFCFALHTYMPGDDVNNGNPFNVDLKIFWENKWWNVSQDNFKISGSTLQSSVGVNVGACSWTEAGGSERQVTFTITGASVTIVRAEGGSWGPYTSSRTISLPAGHYTYTWWPTEGYRCVEPYSGSFVVDPCPAASASATPGACNWSEGTGSLTNIVMSISNATLTIKDDSNVKVFEGSSVPATPLTLEPGHYTYSWIALPGFSGTGTGSFDLIDCEPEKGSASVNAGACSWDENSGSTFLLTITLNNATLTINNVTYTETTTDIKLDCGTYPYTWAALDGYQGGGAGTVEVDGCEPASANVIVGACDWINETSLTPVSINVHGATLTLFVDNEGSWESIGTFGEGSHTETLPTGSYKYTWTAIEDFVGSGDGTFETLYCEPGKADASVSIGACTYSDGNSLTLVTITVNGAVLTIDGQDYVEFAELKLFPGEYPYSWTALEGFQGEGDGILSISSCKPKGGDDPSPDVAAGGSGPSLLLTLAPAALTVSGIGLAWILIKRRIKNI